MKGSLSPYKVTSAVFGKEQRNSVTTVKFGNKSQSSNPLVGTIRQTANLVGVLRYAMHCRITRKGSSALDLEQFASATNRSKKESAHHSARCPCLPFSHRKLPAGPESWTTFLPAAMTTGALAKPVRRPRTASRGSVAPSGINTIPLQDAGVGSSEKAVHIVFLELS
jgi:hypothetical protein